MFKIQEGGNERIKDKRGKKSIRKQGLASMGLKHEEDSADQPNFPYAQGQRLHSNLKGSKYGPFLEEN